MWSDDIYICTIIDVNANYSVLQHSIKCIASISPKVEIDAHHGNNAISMYTLVILYKVEVSIHFYVAHPLKRNANTTLIYEKFNSILLMLGHIVLGSWTN